MNVRGLRRRAAGYALWQWRRRTPGPASSAAPDAVRRSLSERDRWSVIILTDRPSQWRLQPWLRTFFHDDVLIYATGYTPTRTRQPSVTIERLKTIAGVAADVRTRPPADLIVDLRENPTDASQQEAWRRLFVCVALGGAYVHRDIAREGDEPVQGWARTVAGLADARPMDDLARALGSATGSVRASGGYAVHVKTAVHYLKVPERRIAVLETRAPRLSVDLRDSLPGVAGIVSPPVHGYERDDPAAIDRLRFDAPTASMRHYRGPMRVLGHLAVVHETTLLPPSFGYPTEPVPLTVLGTDVTADFATLPATVDADVPGIAGDFYDLNAAYPAHFGHFITEVPAKLWGWDAAKAANPQLRAIVRIPKDYEPTYERELLHAYGIGEDDILWQRRPVAVDSLIACTPLWQSHDRFVSRTPQWQDHEPYWYHPAIRDTWARLRSALLDPGREPGARRLFIARPEGMHHRDCRNAPAVQALFEEYGFTVAHPERHTFAEQAALFADAAVVAGFGGSGMFNMLFSEQLQHVIVLNHEAYHTRNEHLYAAAQGAESHTFWSVPDVPQKGSRHEPKAFHSAWSFDFARNEAALRETLAALDV